MNGSKLSLSVPYLNNEECNRYFADIHFCYKFEMLKSDSQKSISTRRLQPFSESVSYGASPMNV